MRNFYITSIRAIIIDERIENVYRKIQKYGLKKHLTIHII